MNNEQLCGVSANYQKVLRKEFKKKWIGVICTMLLIGVRRTSN